MDEEGGAEVSFDPTTVPGRQSDGHFGNLAEDVRPRIRIFRSNTLRSIHRIQRIKRRLGTVLQRRFRIY